jgi:hypothetical protein
LTIGDGGSLVHAGELDLDHGAVLNITATTTTATLTIKPGSGASCTLYIKNIGTGAAEWNLNGTSTSIRATVTGDLSGGGTAFLVKAQNGGTQPIFSVTYGEVDNCGNATTACSSSFAVSGDLNIAKLLLINDGEWDITGPANGTNNIVLDGLNFINPVSLVAMKVSDTTATTSGTRTAKNIVIYADTASAAATLAGLPAFQFNVNGGQCGFSTARGDSSDAPCIQAYNGSVGFATSTTVGNIIREPWFIFDAQKNSGSVGTALTLQAANGQVVQDGIVYDHFANAHQFVASTNRAGTATQYNGNLCDGDFFYEGDTSNFIEDNGNHFSTFNLDIDACGELDSDEGSSTAFNVTNNTTYQAFGVSLGNSNMQYTPLVIKRNLFVFPDDPTGIQGIFQTGLVVQAAMPSQQATNWPNYNGYFMMMGSGDTDPVMGSATSCASGSARYYCPLPNATDGSTVSYVGMPSVVRVSSSRASTVSGTRVTCSSCNFTASGVRVGDFLVALQVSGRPYAQITAVNSSTSVTIVSAIAGFTSGQYFTIQISYWSAAGIAYGSTSGYGTNDIHANPYFVDPTRNNCTYFVTIGGGTANCQWNAATGGSGNYYTSTSVSGTALINDTNANFTATGWTADNDWVVIYAGATLTFRCAAQVTAVSATQITISPACTGLTSGDAFSNITATRLLGRQIVTINGWDYQGHPTTPAAWAQTSLALAWIYQGYMPHNLIYKGAGDDGSDIGAVPIN